MIRALIFDFDGLILETESPIFQSWQELYRDYGQELSFATWAKIIGTADTEYHPGDELDRLVGESLDWTVLDPQRKQRELDLIANQPVLPGVKAYLERAQALDLRLAVASSSTRSWVAGHLARLELLHYFHTIKTSDDVPRTKPDPALYLAVLEALDLHPDEAVVFEDSPNGLQAAQRAGIYAVAVPNALTRRLPMNHARMHLHSLDEIALDDLIARVEADLGSTAAASPAGQ